MLCTCPLATGAALIARNYIDIIVLSAVI